MFVGNCKNGVSFVKVMPHEIYRLRETLPFDEEEIEKLAVDIATNMSGKQVLPSGYAVMWRWTEAPTRHFILVFKKVDGGQLSGTEIGGVKSL